MLMESIYLICGVLVKLPVFGATKLKCVRHRLTWPFEKVIVKITKTWIDVL